MNILLWLITENVPIALAIDNFSVSQSPILFFKIVIYTVSLRRVIKVLISLRYTSFISISPVILTLEVNKIWLHTYVQMCKKQPTLFWFYQSGKTSGWLYYNWVSCEHYKEDISSIISRNIDSNIGQKAPSSGQGWTATS